jgi:hypothetical protein
MTVVILLCWVLTNKILVTLHISNLHHLAKKNLTGSLYYETNKCPLLDTCLQIWNRCRCSKRKTKWQLTVMQITSKALKVNFWQHKTRQCEMFTNNESWKYGECKHCWPLIKKAGCLWGAEVAFWCRIELLLATRILGFISKWCKAIDRKANYVQK